MRLPASDADVVPTSASALITSALPRPFAHVRHDVLVRAAAQVDAEPGLALRAHHGALVHAAHHADVEVERVVRPRGSPAQVSERCWRWSGRSARSAPSADAPDAGAIRVPARRPPRSRRRTARRARDAEAGAMPAGPPVALRSAGAAGQRRHSASGGRAPGSFPRGPRGVPPAVSNRGRDAGAARWRSGRGYGHHGTAARSAGARVLRTAR